MTINHVKNCMILLILFSKSYIVDRIKYGEISLYIIVPLYFSLIFSSFLQNIKLKIIKINTKNIWKKCNKYIMSFESIFLLHFGR